MDHLSEKMPTHLPDTVLLNLLLQCKALLDLQKYMNMHLTMSQVKYYHGKYTMHFLLCLFLYLPKFWFHYNNSITATTVLYFVKLNMNILSTGQKAYQGVIKLSLCLI